ncbi:response regulator [Flavobacterium amniphilum]|uniref:response regulator n=1 Tax=Flavobacterium amniphilum TaxID=1834035 RepID=UPI002029D210|nr:response regulator [Flavobacterium amniphilum]MCL9806533.1 response regulator [Flavobacterium amniphilum]
MIGRNLKILILEDTISDADLLTWELKKSDYDFVFEVVQNRETFIKALNDFKPDLILSDFSLPSFDGFNAFQIKQQEKPDIPFIIVSGAIGEEKAVELIKNGVTDYVQKDKLFTLNQKINRALKEVEEKNEKKIAEEKIRTQNKKLLEIAFLQSHQIRRPVADILGLISIFNFDEPCDPENVEILTRLETTATDLDGIIREIVEKTNEIE